MSFFAEVGPDGGWELAANHVVEGAGQAEAGWKLVPEVLSKVCDSFELVLLESLLKERLMYRGESTRWIAACSCERQQSEC